MATSNLYDCFASIEDSLSLKGSIINNYLSKMGSCAGCGGPNRRAEKYKVNRLTEDSPMKSSITPSELPIRKHKERVIDDLNETKKRIDSNNLINTLLNSSVMYNEPVSSQGVRSSSKWGSPGYQK